MGGVFGAGAASDDASPWPPSLAAAPASAAPWMPSTLSDLSSFRPLALRICSRQFRDTFSNVVPWRWSITNVLRVVSASTGWGTTSFFGMRPARSMATPTRLRLSASFRRSNSRMCWSASAFVES